MLYYCLSLKYDLCCCSEKPLALYVFSTNKKVVDKIVEQTSSGGLCVNDVMVQGGCKYSTLLVSTFCNYFGGVMFTVLVAMVGTCLLC